MRDSSNFGGGACGSPAACHGSPAKYMSALNSMGEEPLSPAVMRTLVIAGRQAALLIAPKIMLTHALPDSCANTVHNTPQCESQP